MIIYSLGWAKKVVYCYTAFKTSVIKVSFKHNNIYDWRGLRNYDVHIKVGTKSIKYDEDIVYIFQPQIWRQHKHIEAEFEKQYAYKNQERFQIIRIAVTLIAL